MANTYELISSNILSTATASVTFSSIPATYTDLVVRATFRATGSGTGREMAVSFNGTTTGYSFTLLNGTSGVITSTRSSNDSSLSQLAMDSAGNTADTFSSFEAYIPSYTASQNKPVLLMIATEENATNSAWLQANAGLWRNTAAITSVKVDAQFTTFVSGSSFYLYGIKNT